MLTDSERFAFVPYFGSTSSRPTTGHNAYDGARFKNDDRIAKPADLLLVMDEAVVGVVHGHGPSR